jgi:hypothetical protein
MSRQQRDVHGVTRPVQPFGQIAHRLRRVAGAVQHEQQPSVRAMQHDRLGAQHDAVDAGGKAGGVFALDAGRGADAVGASGRRGDDEWNEPGNQQDARGIRRQ